MSQPVPPPNQPHDAQPGGNPFAGQQPGAPTGNPFAGQQPGMPFAPPAPARNNLGLGLAAGFVAAVVAAAIYGAIIGATKHEIGYAAVGVGFIVGFAAGKVGGRNPVLPVVSAVLSLVAVYFGQLLGEAMIAAKELPVTVSELFFDHFSLLNEAWKAESDFISYLFFAVAAVAAFSGAKKAGE
ncbi:MULTISPECIES: hypothetical protein [unclassified Streptomyces]|uniref:hypothetical protein n=1 Tax=unclassified Streptomyces TaxID=2593676 RepID=UPI002251E814|nr:MULTISPECIES: hypothetical protein [unclassified Streptomyces]MCX4394550.1 hypothetical protein [Streptomyces sp. NBC_01767]WSC28240.1 hypothetical protein OG902_16845 [Streptomyces sp. NBC_01768]WSX03463.1 hypothetical protein OG355_25305 [Streptomyces sp. NBC_00987]